MHLVNKSHEYVLRYLKLILHSIRHFQGIFVLTPFSKLQTLARKYHVRRRGQCILADCFSQAVLHHVSQEVCV
jgi:hypothetical protein